MKFLLFGKGQMGQAYNTYLSSQSGVEVSIAAGVDIRNKEQVAQAVDEYKPDVIINCAGKTNLDWCEQNRLECFDVNTLGADVVAEVAQEQNIYLVHLSSGCVQESLTAEEVHKEDDPPHPTSYYSWTKVWAENLILERARRKNLKALIIRGRQLVSAVASPRNALTKMLTYTKFVDTPNSMTVVEDMVDATYQLVQKNATGVFNVANPGIMTPYHIAELLKELVKPEMEFVKIPKLELNAMTLAQRIDCILDCGKLEGQGIRLKPAEERLRELLPQLKANLAQNADVLTATEKETQEKLSIVKGTL